MKLTNLNHAPEIFYSLQGEGASIGSPALFLRLAGCNLSCTWCDTAYSWKQSNAIELMREQLVDILADAPCRRLIITGGEPLLQQAQIVEILDLLDDWKIEIETNGTLMPCPELCARIDQWNVSPKLNHSGNKSEQALKPSVLEKFTELGNAWFKFVISDDSQWSEIEALSLPLDKIILMPRAQTKEELDYLRPLVANICLSEGVRLGDRLHLTLWGSKKGV